MVNNQRHFKRLATSETTQESNLANQHGWSANCLLGGLWARLLGGKSSRVGNVVGVGNVGCDTNVGRCSKRVDDRNEHLGHVQCRSACAILTLDLDEDLVGIAAASRASKRDWRRRRVGNRGSKLRSRPQMASQSQLVPICRHLCYARAQGRQSLCLDRVPAGRACGILVHEFYSRRHD